MKLRHLFHTLVLFVVLFGSIGNSQLVKAQANTDAQPGTIVVIHELTYWDATYIGNVDALRYEKWSFVLNEPHTFVVTATPTADGLTTLILLLDGNGNELARGTGTLTSTQSAGNYFVQIQPEAGSGSYNLTLRQVNQDQPSVTTIVTPATVNVGETAAVSANLNNVPTDGYSSAEFTCTYDAGLGEVSNIVAGSLFGSDPAMAVNGPQNGSFIVAIAGSNGNKDTTSGAALSFNIKGLQAGQIAIECKARVSKGDKVLTGIASTAAGLKINGIPPTATALPTTFPTAFPTALPTALPTPTPLLPVASILSGQVIASKPVTVSLYNADNSLATSVLANADGTFSLTAPAGTYTVIARAAGFLSAQGSAILIAGATATKPTVSLPAGDIDGNNVIDQYDAMTIGMSYNTAVPVAADLNNDGIINVLDLELLAANFRKSGALAWQ